LGLSHHTADHDGRRLRDPVLAERLVGLDVVMYMGGRLVKSTIGFSPGAVPTHGRFAFRGKRYRAYTFDARAFPSGPLRITVLIPLPYS